MADSFILLSSMSPQIKAPTVCKKKVTKPTKLALKKNIRRSSTFYTFKFTPRNDSMIIIESDCESIANKSEESIVANSICSNTSLDENDDNKVLIKYLSESTSEVNKCKKWSNSKSAYCHSSTQDQGISILCKFEEISRGLEELDFNQTSPAKIRNDERGTEDKNIFLKADKVSAKEESIIYINSSSDIIEDSDEQNDSVEKALDDIYGNSWRKSKNLVFSEPRRNKTPLSIASLTPRSEVKCSTMEIKKNLLEFRHRKLFEDYKKTFNSPLQTNIKALCDSDFSDEKFQVDIGKSKVRLSFTNNDSSLDSFDKLLIDDAPKNKVEDNKNIFGPLVPKILATNSNTKKVKKKVKTKKTPIPDNNESSDEEVKLYTGKPKTKAFTRRPRKNIKKVFTLETSDSECEIDLPKTPFSFLASLSHTVKLENCDPSARIFRNHFQMYKTELTKKLFQLYNEKVFDNSIHADTPLGWNKNMRKTAGFCYNRLIKHSNGSTERKVRIDLSVKVLDSADRLRDTLIHEMCHAAVWIVNEIRDGHGNFFKAWGNKALKVFPELPPIKTCHSYIINSKYTYRCIGCGYSIGRHSKSIDVESKRCGYCYGKLELLINKKNKDGETRAVPVTPKRQPTGFALFVKENYGIYKSPQLNHGQVMKLLGEKFNELKV